MRQWIGSTLDYARADGLGPFAVRAVTGTGAIHGAAMTATFAVGVLLARGLGVTGYGEYGIAFAILSLAAIPAELGLPRLVTREVAAAGARGDPALQFGILRWSERTVLAISTAVAVLVAAATLLVLGDPSSALAAAILVGLPMIPLAALAKVEGGALQGLGHIVRGQAPVLLLRPLLLALLLIALFGFTSAAGAPAAIALNVLTAFAALLLAHRWLRSRLPGRAPATLAADSRAWLSASTPMAVTEGLRLSQAQLTIVLVGLFAGIADAALFRIGIALLVVVGTPATIVSTAVMPLLARLHAQGDRERLQKLVTRSAQLQFLGVVLLSLPLFLWAEPLLEFVFGGDYVPAAPIVRVLLVSQLITAAFGLNGPLLNMSGHERHIMAAMLLGLAVNVAIVVALVPAAGAIAAAWAVTISFAAWNLAAWAAARKLAGIDTFVVPLRPRG